VVTCFLLDAAGSHCSELGDVPFWLHLHLDTMLRSECHAMAVAAAQGFGSESVGIRQ